MMWPVLVPDAVCTTPVTIRLELPGINEDGTPREGRVSEAMGNYAEANKWIMDAERRLIRLQAAVLLNGDIAPELETLSGTVTVAGSDTPRVIQSAARARNPDGTVNYTRLELM